MENDIQNNFYDDVEYLIQKTSGKFVAVVKDDVVIEVLACGQETFDMFMLQPKFVALDDKNPHPLVGFSYDEKTESFSPIEHFTASGIIL
jgi:hypothetical protein